MIMRQIYHQCKKHGDLLRDEVRKSTIKKNGTQGWRCRLCDKEQNDKRKSTRDCRIAEQYIDAIQDVRIELLNHLAKRLQAMESVDQKRFKEKIWAINYVGKRLCNGWKINKSILKSITYDGV